MIYATDLDRTIIFSNKFLDTCSEDVVCVEEVENKHISYMTFNSYNKLSELKSKLNLKIIPITTRSVNQFKRVKAVQDCEYAITSNGGTILHNGEVFQPWQQYVNTVINKYNEDFPYVLQMMNRFSELFEHEAKVVDGIFMFTKLKDNAEDIDFFVTQMTILLNLSKWNFTLQGRKFYIIPKEISKENALLYLKKYLKEDKLIVSGDGKLDIGFLSIGDVCIIPDGSEVLDYLPSKSFVYKSVPKGLSGTIDLFNIVEQNL